MSRKQSNGEKAQALSYIGRHLDATYMRKSWRNMDGETIEETYVFTLRKPKEVNGC